MVRRSVVVGLGSISVIVGVGVVGVGPASAAGFDLVALDAANVGKKACDMNSLGGVGFYTSCTGANGAPEPWCADYAMWLWARGGAKVSGLTPESGSFYTYGEANGTLHTNPDYVPQVGDAAVFNHVNGNADHVGIVVAVGADGSVKLTNGNYGEDDATSTVGHSEGRGQVGQVIWSQTISAFVTPVGLVPDGAPPPTPRP